MYKCFPCPAACGARKDNKDKHATLMDNFEDILIQGIHFGGGSHGPKNDDDKVKTKAKKKKYITGAHGSGSARQKAKYREQRANRRSQQRKK